MNDRLSAPHQHQFNSGGVCRKCGCSSNAVRYFGWECRSGEKDSDHVLPSDSSERKDVPLARGLLDYFPSALAEVARLSRAGNEKHNPGEPLHHARGKSTDHADCIMRHLVDRGTEDPEDGILHDVKVAWRALAMLQERLEDRGAPQARRARYPEEDLDDLR